MKKIHWFTDANAIATPERYLSIKDKEVIKQIKKVLRIDVGERIVVRTSGATFEGEIESISNLEIILSQIEEVEVPYPHKKISLFVRVPKKDKFELILEKCTEIGVTDFFPVISERTIKTNINYERSNKIITEACEQSQRSDTPTLHQIRTLEEVVREFRPSVFDVDGGLFSKEDALHTQNVLVGPEGGFSEKEISFFQKEKLDIFKLKGPILKTETAAIVVSGLLLN